MGDIIGDQTDLYGLFQDNHSFKKWLSDTMFQLTTQPFRQRRLTPPETP